MNSRLLLVVALITTLTLTTYQPAFAVCGANETPIFINELHYENVSTDSDEFVEIAGPAGTDLTNWSIELYRDTGTVYGTINLSGSILNQQNGYGTLAFPRAGIQNGPADGLALVDNSGTLIQFLSYEGTLMATAGTANGQTSTDIGVAESDSTPVGHSLQLQGVGECYEDFTWTSPAANTQGSPNNVQTAVILEYFVAVSTGDSVEVSWETSHEVNHAGFNLYRRAANSRDSWSQINSNLIASRGSQAQGAIYQEVDGTVTAGTWEYLLEDVETNGRRYRHLDFITAVETQLPTTITLASNSTENSSSTLPYILLWLAIATFSVIYVRVGYLKFPTHVE